MKKIFTSIMVVAMLLTTSLVNASALTKDESYQAAKKYYETKEVLQGADEVIAYESLGLESDDLAMEYVVNTEYASTIAKTVIALTLHGDDPRDYEGVNYVEMLENCVQKTGAIDKNNDFTYASYQIPGVYALYVVNSEKLERAADYLVSLKDENNAWGSEFGSACDLTGWVIEILSLIDQEKYQADIDDALKYITSKQEASAGYNDALDEYYKANPNTQACVLMGLLTYDEKGVKGNTYNQGENNPYDFLLSFQNKDGSFWYEKAGEDNYFATIQGIQAIGYYHHGSIYQRAQKQYQTLTNENQFPYGLVIGSGVVIVACYWMIKGKKKNG